MNSKTHLPSCSRLALIVPLAAFAFAACDGPPEASSQELRLANTMEVNLRSAGGFAILSKAGITNVPTTAVVGNVGASPITGAAIGITCGEVTGKIYTVDAAGPACRVQDATLLTAAVGDMETAYSDAAGRAPTHPAELGGGNISGMTLPPGVYKWGTGVHIDGRGVTLAGGKDAVWIFQVGNGLTVDAGAKMILAGGAKAGNIFWQVAGGALLDTTVQFKGSILCKTLIALNTGATLDGRALAQTAVTLQMNAVTIPN
jgi:hypothetical protein